MKFTSFYRDSALHTGVIVDGRVADLATAGLSADLKTLISGYPENAEQIVSTASKAEILDYNTLDFAPATQANKVVCVGLNYHAHRAETGSLQAADAPQVPTIPIIFSKFSDALTGSGKAVTLPPWVNKVDYEAELVVLIGRDAWHVSEEDAGDYIFGYTTGNDFSAREAQKATSQWLVGKSLPGFAPCGPVVVTADEFDPTQPHAVICRRNGEVVQNGSTEDLIFSCKKIVSYVSDYIPLAPGDLIFTGTPSGVVLGKPEEEAVWLAPGEVIEVEIEGIGTLTNPLK